MKGKSVVLETILPFFHSGCYLITYWRMLLKKENVVFQGWVVSVCWLGGFKKSKTLSLWENKRQNWGISALLKNAKLFQWTIIPSLMVNRWVTPGCVVLSPLACVQLWDSDFDEGVWTHQELSSNCVCGGETWKKCCHFESRAQKRKMSCIYF